MTLAKDETLEAILGNLGADPIYEIDSLAATGATGGSVQPQFSWDGIVWTMPAVQWNASAAAVQAAVQQAVGAANQLMPAEAAVCSGGPLNVAPVTIRFQGAVVGPVSAQAVTNSTLTGAAATFTRTLAGLAGGVGAALAAYNGGANPGMGFLGGVRGSDGKVYAWGGPGVGDGGVTPQVYLGGGASQGNIGSGAPLAALGVAFRNPNNANLLQVPNMDANGAFTLQSAATPGSAPPAKGLLVGGSDGAAMRTLLTDALGKLLTAAMAAAGSPAPADVDVVGGVDPGGVTRAAGITAAGALSVQDASAVPENPISINGAAFTVGQAGAPAAPIAVNAASTPILPDSTGGGAVNGPRGQLEVVNLGNVDVFVSPSITARWGALWLLRPGGSLVTTYSGPVSAIQNGTSGGQPPAGGAPVASSLSVAEWA